jgi:hypothetical protein
MEVATRRAFLAAAVGAVAAAIGRVVPAVAADDQPVVLGQYNQATRTTYIDAPTAPLDVMASSEGPALSVAAPRGGAAVVAYASDGYAVQATADGTAAIKAQSTNGTALLVRGRRGAVLDGGDGPLRLMPRRQTHPDRGLKGDLFVDTGGRLWFCRGADRWVRLA